MSWKGIAEKVGKIAPLAGSLLGGPAGGTIGAMIASALGAENNPGSVAVALNDPEAALKLKELELTNQAEFERLAVEQYKAEAQERRNAREQNKHSLMPAVIVIVLTIIVAGSLWALLTLPIPEENKDLCYIMFGAVVAKWGDSIAYWVGTTRSSAQKTLMAGR